MDILIVDKICRICLQGKDPLISLFKKIKGSSPYEKLNNIARTKIEQNDPGPSLICSQCLKELDATVNFLKKCENSTQIITARHKLKFESDPKTAADIKSCDKLGDVKSVSLEINELSSLIEECKRVEVSEKVVESEEEAAASPAPAAAEAASCAQCGSRRRCRHWAPPATHTCQYCQKVFTRKFNFKLHLKRHLGQRDWPCPACGVRLLTRGLAQRHCEPRQRVSCPVPGCGKSFTANTNLTIHMRVHSGERPHVCGECGKSFTSKNTLNAHLRIHTGAKPYICWVCGKQFATNKLAAHARAHAGARPHACPAPACPRAFPSPRALRLHAATHAAHSAHAAPQRQHACPLCPRKYTHSQSLRKHLRQRHAQSTQPQE